MRTSNQILQNFFYKINDSYILNTLYVLLFILKVPEHKERLQEILNISNPNISLDAFTKAVKQKIQHYEGLLEEDTRYLMEEIVTGPAINVIKETPTIWCFISLYWAYDFKHKDHISILSVYNPKIGDIALKFLLYFLKMKQKEAHTACTKHEPSFYEDIAPRLVRIIDTLPVMYTQDSSHLNMQYFPTSKSDLAINFLEVQINNHWEQAALYVKEEKPKNTIRYKHDGENLNLTIKPSRMTKDGAFNDLDKTYNLLMQLFNLDLANSRAKYSIGSKGKGSQKEVQPSIITPLGEELISVDESTDPEVLSIEDRTEQKAKRKVYRRDMKDFSDIDEGSEEEVKEYVIPNAFQQHKQNIAFASKLIKERLRLKSDYDIPITEHLKAFISMLNIEDNDSKIYTAYFILNLSLGCKMQDLMSLLQNKKNGPLHLKNSVITVDIDSSLFAANYSELLSQSEKKLAFNIPIMMTMLIVMMKRTFLAKDFNQIDFLEGYEKFLKNSVKQSQKRITIKWKQVNRYLAQYMQDNGKDVLTGKLATAAFSQNDTAKLAYTSTSSNAAVHSQLIKDYWNELNLAEIASNIIDINIIPSVSVSTINSPNYSGGSQAAKTSKANDFFKVLRQNIYDCHNDEDLHFNLVSIYTRYSMSLLAGTRPFIESANFTSYNKEVGIWIISEKAQDIASGTRLVPLCNIMDALLKDYQKLLDERDLKNDFYLIIDSKPVVFSSYKAHKFLQNTYNLSDHKILEEYVNDMPLNTGRHLFTRKAIENMVDAYYISTYLGHYSAGEEQFGIYSTLDVQDYCRTVKNITTKIAQECGIKEL